MKTMILKIAIQKSGRLSEKSLNLLRECGIDIGSTDRKLLATSTNFPLQVLFLRDDDIPQYVSDGVAHLGILGENVVIEKQKPLEVLEKLGFGKCRLSLAVMRGEQVQDVGYFEGKKIATSYPVILQQFLNDRGVNATIENLSGSVEIAPGIGLADAVCDIVSTGSTLLTNGLEEALTVMRSEAVMVAQPGLDAPLMDIAQQLLFRIRSVNKARQNKYILLNAPNQNLEQIIALLPGMKSPTVLPLAIEGWSSVHSVVPEDKFWAITNQLKELGAEGLLVVPIEKMVL